MLITPAPGAPLSLEANVPGLMVPPAGAIENFSRLGASLANASILTSGQLYLASIGVPAGQKITNITFSSGTTVLAAGLNQWFGFFDTSRNKLVLTADDTSTAWATNSPKTLFVARQVTDASISSGSNVLTSPTAAFTQADVTQQVIVIAAGAASAPLGSSASAVTISSIGLDGANTCRLSTTAGTTVASGGTAYIGTPYTTTNTTPTAFYAGIMVKATVPSLTAVVGGAAAATINTLAPRLNGTSTGSLTDPSSCPGTVAALAAIASTAHCYIS